MQDLREVCIMCDLDGTLVDTEIYRAEALTEILAVYGQSYDLAWHPSIMGRSLLAGAEFLVKTLELAVDPTVLEKAYRDAFMRRIDERGFHPIPGADAVLRAWHEQGIALWIVSGSKQDYVKQALEECGWSNLFSQIIAGDPPMPAKPDPALFIAARAASPCAHNIVIEDAPSGIASAKAAGLPTIGLVNTHYVSHLEGDKQWNGWHDASLQDILSLI